MTDGQANLILRWVHMSECTFSHVCFFQNIHKYYGQGNFHAVKNISIGIPKEECFGLLGQNGAGKTTTFKMLTGDEIVSSGNAYLDRYSVKSDIKKVSERHLQNGKIRR